MPAGLGTAARKPCVVFSGARRVSHRGPVFAKPRTVSIERTIMKSFRVLFLGMAVTLVSGACVTAKTYERKVAEFETFKREEAERVRAARARILGLEQDTASLTRKLRLTEQTLGDKTEDLGDTRRELQGSTEQVASLKRRLEELNQDVTKVSAERAELSASLALTGARLEELRVHAQASEARAQVFRDLVAKLHGMIDAGKLKVVVRQGRMLIALPSDVLFDSGRTEVKKDAKATLAAVADAIRDIRERKFLVVGHTDNLPIHTSRFPSNWELSAGRAIAVARVLMANEIAPRNLGIAGHAEFDPAAANDTAAHRKLNRRIEVVLEPNLTELPTISNGENAPVSLR
jgi:chemotaxis protein MotB